LPSVSTSLIIVLLGSVLLMGAVGAFVSASAFAPPDVVTTGIAGATGAASLSSSIVRGECASLVLNHAQSTIPSFKGSPATLAYGCGTGGFLPAFVDIQLGRSTAPKLTPIFRVPPGWTLGIGRFGLKGECSPGNVVELSSGTSLTLSPNTAYVYCLSTARSSSFSSFSISWSA